MEMTLTTMSENGGNFGGLLICALIDGVLLPLYIRPLAATFKNSGHLCSNCVHLTNKLHMAAIKFGDSESLPFDMKVAWLCCSFAETKRFKISLAAILENVGNPVS